MLSVRQIVAKQLFARNTYALGFGKKRKPTPNDLQKYDVVVVGAGLGNVFAHHLDAVVGQKHKIFLSYDNPVTYYHSERGLYEQGDISKFNFGAPTRQIVSKNIAQSDYVGVDKIYPDKNQVLLRNGRTIKYENLVLALGQKDNFGAIKGFDQAWADPVNPFYTNQDHPSWKTTTTKTYRVHLNFNGGPAYFYIPPTNFYGQVVDYNFLVSKIKWNTQQRTGKFTWQNTSLTVINPNKTFCRHFKRIDDYIKNACYENNIKIENDLTLVEVRKNEQIAVFRQRDTGQLVQRFYGHLYSLMPTTTHSVLADAGLADSTGFLDVNPQTLQHMKYDNIFGIGDVNNVPTTKSFYGGLAQVAVVRHNVERRLNGLSLNAKYDGYTSVGLNASPRILVNVQHKYGGQEVSYSADKVASTLRFLFYAMTGKHNHQNILKFKNWGPPYYKFKKTFQGGEPFSSVPAKPVPTALQPDKKKA